MKKCFGISVLIIFFMVFVVSISAYAAPLTSPQSTFLYVDSSNPDAGYITEDTFDAPALSALLTDESGTAQIVSSNSETYNNLYAAVQGEMNASASYLAYAEKARADGHKTIARLFMATADAEAKHADDEWAILRNMGAVNRPVAQTPTVGTTAENLKATFDGETYEYTTMYTGFFATAQEEGMTDAARIFRLAMQAEAVHAVNYNDVLQNLADTSYVNDKYAVVYRCPTCGEVVTSRPNRCPICGVSGANFVMYSFVFPSYSVEGKTVSYLWGANGKALDLDVLLDASGTESTQISIIAALYNQDGSLSTTLVQFAELSNDEYVTYRFSLAMPADTEGMQLSLFLWDGMIFEPLLPAYVLN